MKKETHNSPIAVVALSSILPGSLTSDRGWSNILQGKDLITDVPPTHWLKEDYFEPDADEFPKVSTKTGAFLSEIPFDPTEFGMPPNTIAATDTNQLLALIAAKRLLKSTKSIQNQKVDLRNTGIILGVAAGSEMQEQMSAKIQKPVWTKVLREHGLAEDDVQQICENIIEQYPDWTENTFPGLLSNVVAGRVANKLNLGGCNFVTDAACASSLSAVNMAMLELRAGNADLIFSGGVDALNSIFMYLCFARTHALSPTGDIRPFSNEADGTILGEGVVLLALRRLEDAERDGDDIYAVLNSCGSSSDGKLKSIYAPSSEGQSRAINRTYENLAYGLGDVGLIEAHGTGTKAGDAAEFSGLCTAFANDPLVLRKAPQYCALGSIKSQIGHTKSTAGAAGLLKVIYALQHKILPPTIKIKKPNDTLKIENSPFYLNTQTRPWIHPAEEKRRAGVSSFGFGGSNFHISVEEYTGPANQAQKIFCHADNQGILLTLSADSAAALKGQLSELQQTLTDSQKSLLTIARSSQMTFQSQHKFRICLVARDTSSAQTALNKFLSKWQSNNLQSFTIPNTLYFQAGKQQGKVAFLFSGQGSQYLNMGHELLCQYEQARAPWDTSASLDWFSDKSLHQVVYPIPSFTPEQSQTQSEEFLQIKWIQPAIGALSLSHLNLINTLGLCPDSVAGHSYGELSALYAAGVIESVEDLLEISKKRAELMNAATQEPLNINRPGGMTAVMTGKKTIESLQQKNAGELSIANINSPRQTVITGAINDLDIFETILKDAGLTFKRLNVPTAFHSPWVASCEQPFLNFLQGKSFSQSTVPVYSNLSGGLFPTQGPEIKKCLAKQLSSPVRFADEIQKMAADGVQTFIEFGPGKTLTGLVKDTLADSVAAISIDGGPRVDSMSAFWVALAQIAALGLPVDLKNLWLNFAEEQPEPRQENYSKAAVMISGANYGKIYPPKEGVSALPLPNFKAKIMNPNSPPTAHQAQPETRTAASSTPSASGTFSDIPGNTIKNSTYNNTEPVMSKNLPPKDEQPVSPSQPHSPEWLRTIQEIQETLFQAQQAFQKALTESHKAYLQATGNILNSITQGNTGQGMNSDRDQKNTPLTSSPIFETPDSFTPKHIPSPPPLAPPIMSVQTKDQSTFTAPTEIMGDSAGPSGTKSKTNETEHSPEEKKQPQMLQTPSDSLPDFKTLLLDIVTKATGYPQEMLDLELDMETELGIDSIKRVEILSDLQCKLPILKEVDTTKLTALNTLKEILDFATEMSESHEDVPAQSHFVHAIADVQDQKKKSCRYPVIKSASPLIGLALQGLQSADNLIIVNDNQGVGQFLATELEQAGISSHICTFAQACQSKSNQVIYLEGLNLFTNPSFQKLASLNQRAFELARHLANLQYDQAGILVTVHNTLGSPNHPYSGGLSALIKTASKEWPNFALKSLDLQTDDSATFSPQKAADFIVQELLAGGMELEVAYDNQGNRSIFQSPSQNLKNGQDHIQDGNIWIVSGGLKGITADCLMAMAQKKKLKLAILGRSELCEEQSDTRDIDNDATLKKTLLEKFKSQGKAITPKELKNHVDKIYSMREMQANLKRLQDSGSSVSYFSCDICNDKKVNEVICQVREKWGAVHGVIHGAGILADKLIKEKTTEQFSRVFDTKVQGLKNLLKATENDPLNVLCCFSSVASRSGNAGQVDYAMANEILNKVCLAEKKVRQQAGQPCLVKSINWGPWDGGMVSPQLKKHFMSQGIELLPTIEGSQAFVEELHDSLEGPVEVVIGGSMENRDLPLASDNIVFDLYVQEKYQPWLQSHRIKEQPVVPAMMASEWFLRVGRTLLGGPVYLKNFKVVKGMILDKFAGQGNWFQITAQPFSQGLLLEIKDPQQITHYRVEAHKSRNQQPAPLPALSTQTENWSIKNIYPRCLFHGPDFQVIQKLSHFSTREADAHLKRGSFFGGAQQLWESDVALLDGGVQLAILWLMEKLDKDSLPTGFKKLTIHQKGQVKDKVMASFITSHHDTYKTRGNLFIHTHSGERIATVEELEITTGTQDLIFRDNKGVQ